VEFLCHDLVYKHFNGFNLYVPFQFCFAHDTARVIQALIQHGTPEHRETVFDELKGMHTVLECNLS